MEMPFDKAVVPIILNPQISEDWEQITQLKADKRNFISDEILSQVSDLIKSDFPDKTIPKEELKQKALDFLGMKSVIGMGTGFIIRGNIR